MYGKRRLVIVCSIVFLILPLIVVVEISFPRGYHTRVRHVCPARRGAVESIR